jgi:acyl carrier protein
MGGAGAVNFYGRVRRIVMEFGVSAGRVDNPEESAAHRPCPSNRQQTENSVAMKAALAPQPDVLETEIEDRILSICRRLLQSDELTFSDSFFAEGGNSLLGMTLMLEIESQLGLEIGIETIFGSSTILELCTSVRASGKRMPAVVLPLKQGRGRRIYTLFTVALSFRH